MVFFLLCCRAKGIYHILPVLAYDSYSKEREKKAILPPLSTSICIKTL
uniref:Uncharacterized protein n=1 Tax=Anguilla anguilla TaxID=7936 RepID=A0A0E9VC81_ANGAN